MSNLRIEGGPSKFMLFDKAEIYDENELPVEPI